MEDSMLSKRLIGLSLVVSTIFISHRAFGMVTAAVGIAGVYGCLKAYRWWHSPSQETIEAETAAKALEPVAEQAKQAVKNTAENQIASLGDKIKKIEQGDSGKDLQPLGLCEKLARYYRASCDVIKRGSKCIWTITFKNHPGLTVTVIVLSTGYVIYEKYGKKIKRVILQNLPDCYCAELDKPADITPMACSL
jgi:hypothetical protein